MAAILIAAGLLVAAAAPAEVAWVTGNGMVTVGLDAAGRIAQLNWPGPGAPNHAGEGGWLVQEGKSWRAIGAPVATGYAGPASLVLETRFETNDPGRYAVQRVFALPDAAVVAVALALQGYPRDTRVAWRQQIEPVTSRTPGGESLGAQPAGRRGFVTYYDPERQSAAHFRPGAPGRDTWSHARTLVAAKAPASSWRAFDDGVYWEARPRNPVARAGVAPAGESDALLKAGEDTRTAVIGPAVAAWVLEPVYEGDRAVYTMLLGAGEDARAAAAAIGGVEAVWPVTADAGAAWLSMAPASLSADARRDLLDLLLCVDRASGAIVSTPITIPPGNVVSAFDTAWAVAALDGAGYTDLAGGALDFLIDRVRLDSRSGYPAGSLPAEFYTAGMRARLDRPAAPESAAWLLAAAWRHCAHLGPEAGAAWAARADAVLAACAGFLARDPGAGRVLRGGAASETVSMALLKTQYLGLESARLLGEFRGKPEPGVCADRREELYSRIRFRQINRDAEQAGEAPWAALWVRTMDSGSRSSRWDVLLEGWEGGNMPAAEGPWPESAPSALRAALRLLPVR